MTRYSEEHKTRTRRRILRSAGRMFRARGFAGSGVDAVMRGAGLTHGGFYAHFPSKAALFAEAVRDAIEDSGRRIEDGLEGEAPAVWLRTVVERYLSAKHLGAVRDGCPLPSLVSEIDRAPKAVKVAFAEAGRERLDRVARRFAALGCLDPEGESLAMFSALAGALAMARAMPDAETAESVMAATRRRWLERIASYDAG